MGVCLYTGLDVEANGCTGRMSTLAAFHLVVRNVMIRYLMLGVTSSRLRIVLCMNFED